MHGRWPDVGLWLCLLALADWKGEIDCTPQYIASVTGLSVDEVTACIERFMQPDVYSRSQAEEGRRLTLIDPVRNWGWRVVNIASYRKKASGTDQVTDGRNAAKVRRYKEGRKTPKDTEGHHETPKDTTEHSETRTHTQTNTQTREEPPLPPSEGGSTKARQARSPKTSIPDGFELDGELQKYAVDRLPDVDLTKLLESFRGKAVAKGWKYANWRQAFQEFVRNCAPESGHFASNQYPRKPKDGAMMFAGKPVEWQ